MYVTLQCIPSYMTHFNDDPMEGCMQWAITNWLNWQPRKYCHRSITWDYIGVAVRIWPTSPVYVILPGQRLHQTLANKIQVARSRLTTSLHTVVEEHNNVASVGVCSVNYVFRDGVGQCHEAWPGCVKVCYCFAYTLFYTSDRFESPNWWRMHQYILRLVVSTRQGKRDFWFKSVHMLIIVTYLYAVCRLEIHSSGFTVGLSMLWVYFSMLLVTQLWQYLTLLHRCLLQSFPVTHS